MSGAGCAQPLFQHGGLVAGQSRFGNDAGGDGVEPADDGAAAAAFAYFAGYVLGRQFPVSSEHADGDRDAAVRYSAGGGRPAHTFGVGLQWSMVSGHAGRSRIARTDEFTLQVSS